MISNLVIRTSSRSSLNRSFREGVEGRRLPSQHAITVAIPQIAKPKFRAPAFKLPEHPPIFPIVSWDISHQGLRTDGKPATATFISERGLFVTARHIFELNEEPHTLRILFHNPNHYVALPFVASLHERLDVAIGFVEEVPSEMLKKRFVIGSEEMRAEEEIWTLGYGEHATIEHEGSTPGSLGLTMNLWPALRKGSLLDTVERTPLVEGPVHIHSAYTPGGNSGGPLIRASTQTLQGITSSGVEPQEMRDAYGVATDIRAVIDWPISICEGRTLRELASRNIVHIR